MKDPSSPKRKPKKTWYTSHYSGSHHSGFHGIVMHLSSTCPFQPNSSQLASSRWFLEDLPKKKLSSMLLWTMLENIKKTIAPAFFTCWARGLYRAPPRDLWKVTPEKSWSTAAKWLTVRLVLARYRHPRTLHRPWLVWPPWFWGLWTFHIWGSVG